MVFALKCLSILVSYMTSICCSIYVAKTIRLGWSVSFISYFSWKLTVCAIYFDLLFLEKNNTEKLAM